MGVYVSEINMPQGEGSKLVLQIFPNGEVYDGHGIRLGIANWAEAVPVPPHGKLIDADALEKDIDKYIGGEESRSRFHHWVQVQSVVIPGNKGEQT